MAGSIARRAALSLALAGMWAALAVPEAHAIEFKAPGTDWTISFEGNVNGFFVYEDGDLLPPGVDGNGVISGGKASRVRTGLLPGFFTFAAKTEIEGLKLGARISFAPQIQNAATRNQFGSQIDLREIFLTVGAGWGEVLVGRTLNLYQRNNILTDMTLFGVGVQGGTGGGGTTLGRIGTGYIYPNFNGQIRYTTPDLGGFQVAAAVSDPSRIRSADVDADPVLPGVQPVNFAITESPLLEAEATYNIKLGMVGLKFFLSGLTQEAENAAGASVTASGVAGGTKVDIADFSLVLSGYSAKGVGTTLQLDTNSLDPLGNERDSDGFIVQGTYRVLGATTLGLSYGESSLDRGPADLAPVIKTNSALTFGIYHDVNKYLKLVAEYTRAKSEWHNGLDQEADIFALGAMLFW